MNVRRFALASSLAFVASVGTVLAEPPDPDVPDVPAPLAVRPVAPTRVRPTVDLDGTHVVEVALYSPEPREGFDTGITVTGFRDDGCGFSVESTRRARRDRTTVIALGVRASAVCTPEDRGRDMSSTACLGALEAGHYGVTLGGLTLPFDVAARVAVGDEWAVRLAVAVRYPSIGVHACGMPPYYRDGVAFPFDIERVRRERPDVWAAALEIGKRNYPPSPEEEAARLIGIGGTLRVEGGRDGAWTFAFTSSSCCSTTTTTGTTTVRAGVVTLPEDGQLRHETVTREGCRESDFPV